MLQPTKRPQSDIIDTLQALLMNIVWDQFRSAYRNLYWLEDRRLEMTEEEKDMVRACARWLVKEWYGTLDTEAASKK